jgi:ubiquinone/menaquinone biosynthesis C-methylase UbiE
VPHYLFAEPTFNGKVVGVDASWKMLLLAAEKLAGWHGRFLPIQQLAGRLPFADDTFHGVVCLESLEFFPSDEAALREMARVLQPGGVLMVTRRTGWEAKTFVGRFHSPEAFEAMLAELGLVDIRTRPWQVDYDQVMAKKMMRDA